jgi:hypothetical protein
MKSCRFANKFGWSLLAIAAIAALPTRGWGAERVVMGEEFSETW